MCPVRHWVTRPTPLFLMSPRDSLRPMHQLLALVLMGFSGILSSFAAADTAHRCEVYEDSQGLTHAKAPDETGAFACMGYVHARDRAWQMDYFRRISQGRTAEILGFDSLRTDFFMRLLGL